MLFRSRIPYMMGWQHRRAVCKKCVESIIWHIQVLRRVNMSSIVDTKPKQYIVSVLYLMKHGVVMNGVQVLPRIPWLKKILPSEGSLQALWSIKAKCLTETENIIKDIMKNAGQKIMSESISMPAPNTSALAFDVRKKQAKTRWVGLG